MEYILRDYQEEAVSKAMYEFKNYTSPFVLSLACGAGKSLIAADMCYKIYEEMNEPVLVIQDNLEILVQNYNKLKSYGIDDIGIYSASAGERTVDARFIYATIGSVFNKPELFSKFKHVIIDECDLLSWKTKRTKEAGRNIYTHSMYKQFLTGLGKNVKVCGMTATPYRSQKKVQEMGNKYLTTTYSRMINRLYPVYFKKIVFQITAKELVDRGYLVPLKYINRNMLDASALKINTTGAGFKDKELDAALEDKKNMETIVKAYNYAKDKRNHILIFMKTIKACEQLKQMLGYDVDVVHSKMKMADRVRILQKFKRGEIKAVLNVGVLTVGFDFPALDCIIDASPTLSPRLCYQKWGRGSRIFDGKLYCLIIDLVGNFGRFGDVCNFRIEKEDFYKDVLVGDHGAITGVPLKRFMINK